MQTAASGSVLELQCPAARASHRARAAAASRTYRRANLLSSISPISRPDRPQHASGRVQRRFVAVQAQPKKLSAEELEVALADRDVPTIVDFYATWCGPCVLLSKELEKVAEDLGDGVRIFKVDTDENPALSSQLQIQGLPTMVFLGTDATKPALRTEGLLPAETIKQIVANELS